MARSPLLGHIRCPECDFSEAEVRQDKSGAAYRFCPECNAQYFTRGGKANERLRAAMRPIGGTPTAPPAVTDPPAVTVTVTEPPAGPPAVTVTGSPAEKPVFRTVYEKRKWEEEQRRKGKANERAG